MANVVFQNTVLEAKLNSTLNTKMGVRGYMKIDESLSQNAGDKKVVNVYTYTGAVEDVAVGATNAVRGAISFTPVEYTVKVSQQVFDYTDEDFNKDDKIVDLGLEGMAGLMTSDMNTKFFAELGKATLGQTYVKNGAISYDTVVDAISKMNLEDETSLFLVIGTDLKASLRKDADFKASRLGEIIYNGQIGDIAGIPVVVSKLVPAKGAFVASKEAVTLFIKKDSEVEQARDGEKRINTIIGRKVALVALTDSTKVVKITEALA